MYETRNETNRRRVTCGEGPVQTTWPSASYAVSRIRAARVATDLTSANLTAADLTGTDVFKVRLANVGFDGVHWPSDETRQFSD